MENNPAARHLQYMRQMLSPTKIENGKAKSWTFAVIAGDIISYQWLVDAFEMAKYYLCVYSPNGFYREYIGDKNDHLLNASCDYENRSEKKLSGNITLILNNKSDNIIYRMK